MKLIKEFLCDNKIPSDGEIWECLEIAEKDDCVVKLKWFYPHSGWYQLHIEKGMTFADCKNELPKFYSK